MADVEHVEQPVPVATDGPHIHDLVAAEVRDSLRPHGLQVAVDIARRKEIGVARYGQPLQAGNGRNALRDAYEEALDLLVYLRQYQEETGTHTIAYDQAIQLACRLAELVHRESSKSEGES